MWCMCRHLTLDHTTAKVHASTRLCASTTYALDHTTCVMVVGEKYLAYIGGASSLDLQCWKSSVLTTRPPANQCSPLLHAELMYTSMQTQLCTHARMHARMYTCTHARTCTHTHTHAHTYTHTRAHTHTHTHARGHAHTHTCTCTHTHTCDIYPSPLSQSPPTTLPPPAPVPPPPPPPVPHRLALGALRRDPTSSRQTGSRYSLVAAPGTARSAAHRRSYTG